MIGVIQIRFCKLSEKVTFVDFEQGEQGFSFLIGIPNQKSETYDHLETPPMFSMETKVMSRDSLLDSNGFQKNFIWMDSEKGNRVFAGRGGGAQCARPWCLEQKKTWLG